MPQDLADSLAAVRDSMAECDWRRAHYRCEAVLRTQQDCAHGWYLFSRIKLELGALQQAVGAAEHALALEPDNARFQRQLSLALAHVGEQRAALDALDAATLIAPSGADHALTGTVLSLCNQHQRALLHFREAAVLEPRDARHWLNLALTYRALGHGHQAQASCSRAIEFGDLAQAHYLRADLRTYSVADNHIAALRTRLRDTTLPVNDRVYLQFALGKELEDTGSFAEAFAAFQSANGLYRSALRYDVETDLAVLATLVRSHASSTLSRWPAGPEDSRPVFIVGLPRSGTTLVERILQAHSRVVSQGERNDLALEISTQAKRQLGAGKQGPVALVEASGQLDTVTLGSRYLARVMPGADPSQRVIDKMPINYLYCGLIHRALPGARIIALRRNPIDTCFAAWKSLLLGPYGFSYDLTDMARYCGAFHRLLDHWQATLPPSAYREVHYEDLAQQPEAIARSLCSFLELDWEPGMLTFHRQATPSVTASATQVRQPIYRSSVGKWQHYKDHLALLLQALEREGLGVETLASAQPPKR